MPKPPEAGSELSCADLQQAVQAVCAQAVLIAPRILRRVIKQDRELTGWGWKTPHAKSWVIGRERLLEIVDIDELDLPSARVLPDRLILLARPDPESIAELGPGRTQIEVWRLLFHARVHEVLEDSRAAGRLSPAEARARLYQIGPAAFDEIRAVLQQEGFLLHSEDDAEVYVEFASVYLELRHFVPSLLATYFPALAHLAAIDEILAQDVDSPRLFAESRLPGAPDPEDDTGGHEWDDAPLVEGVGGEAATGGEVSDAGEKFRRLLRRAEKAGSVGNLVGALIFQTRALRCAPQDWLGRTQAALRTTLSHLLQRLQRALEIPQEQREAWREPLLALTLQTPHGIWPAESRLLYDLQKVCVDCERGVYTVDLVEWVLSLGQRPIKRALPSQRDVLMTKHLRSAAARLPAVRLSIRQRVGLSELLRSASQQAELRLRQRFRPLLIEALSAVGLQPHNLPETASRNKLVEELLDRIVDSGFLAMGDLRDGLSRNRLKLPDFSGPLDLLRGDQLLRADRRLSQSLDGVHRRGEFYLRWMQQLSSLAFGTRTGRLLTRWVAVPFGGAYMILAFLSHEFHALAGSDSLPSVLLLGSFLAGVFNVPRFREGLVRMLKRAGGAARQWLVAPLLRVMRAEWVQRLLHSPGMRRLWRLLLKPLLLTGVVSAVAPLPEADPRYAWLRLSAVFLLLCLLVNSRVGRNAEELVVDWTVQAWHRFGIRIITGPFWAVIDLFNGLLEGLERLLYTVDEWLRFRTGESLLSAVVKGLLGAVWFLVTYVIRFCVNLLIEPQINPIKHFPVVTVSHKLMFVFVLPSLGSVLSLTMETGLAYTVAGAIVTGIPGIFGFLVWELKENWRLYAANQAETLRPVGIGHHGETMPRLLRWGFHSGTLPKRFAKLRRAERKARRTGQWHAVRKHRHALQQAEHAVRRYVEREFTGLLALHPAWQEHPLTVGEIHVGSRHVQAALETPSLGAEPLEIAWEVQGDWLLAGIRAWGWLPAVGGAQRVLLENALAGLYATASTDMVRQQIDRLLGTPEAAYRFEAQNLVVSPDGQGRSEWLYGLAAEEDDLVPQPVAGDAATTLPALSRQQILFSARSIAWWDWCREWDPTVTVVEPLIQPPMLPREV